MFTVDMSRCPGCHKKETCPDRKRLALELQGIAHGLNSDKAAEPDLATAGGEGIIIVACTVRP